MSRSQDDLEPKDARCYWLILVLGTGSMRRCSEYPGTQSCPGALLRAHVRQIASDTVFRDSAGRTLGTATASRTGTVTYRDAAGRTLSTASETAGRTTFRDASGRTTSTAEKNGAIATFRDSTGRTMGTVSTAGGQKASPAERRR